MRYKHSNPHFSVAARLIVRLLRACVCRSESAWHSTHANICSHSILLKANTPERFARHRVLLEGRTHSQNMFMESCGFEHVLCLDTACRNHVALCLAVVVCDAPCRCPHGTLAPAGQLG